jgi:type II secretory pathway pseudopilin PulG
MQPQVLPVTKRRLERGFTLFEVLIGATILALGLIGLVVTLLNSRNLGRSNEETARAAEALRLVVERMEGVNSADLFRIFNAETTDDPGAAGSAPGSAFALTMESGEYFVEIEFPCVAGAPGVLREDVEDAEMGMPRDLNMDGAVDSASHSTGYVQLPARIRVTWGGVNGTRSMELCTVFLNR